MLKIKSNTNEFTIIFSEKIGKKINAEKFSIPALSFFLLQRLFLLFFSSGQRLSFASTLFFFSVLALPHFSPALTFFFSFGCPLFFSPNIFQPKCFSVFQPKRFSVFQPKRFSVFSAQTFLLQFSHSSLLLFSALFFSGSALFFLFQRLLFFFSLASFIQGPIFSLATSNLFYLNKSLFSSNLE